MPTFFLTFFRYLESFSTGASLSVSPRRTVNALDSFCFSSTAGGRCQDCGGLEGPNGRPVLRAKPSGGGGPAVLEVRRLNQRQTCGALSLQVHGEAESRQQRMHNHTPHE